MATAIEKLEKLPKEPEEEAFYMDVTKSLNRLKFIFSFGMNEYNADIYAISGHDGIRENEKNKPEHQRVLDENEPVWFPEILPNGDNMSLEELWNVQITRRIPTSSDIMDNRLLKAHDHGHMRKYLSYRFTSKNELVTMARFIGERKVLSVCSGLGYVERLMYEAGIDIVATDIKVEDNSWMKVERLEASEALKKHSDRNVLFLCWPEARKCDTACKLAKEFKGQRVIYIGGNIIGCDHFGMEMDKRFVRLSRNDCEYGFDRECDDWIEYWVDHEEEEVEEDDQAD